MSNVLAVNAGSSSLKFQLFNMPKEKVITSGVVERIGLDEGIFTIKYSNQKKVIQKNIGNHQVAVDMLLDLLVSEGIVKELKEIDAVGHRMVHGGEIYCDSVVVNENVIDTVTQFNELAPLHNPANLVGLRAFQKALPDVGHVFVFDTAFHQTMPEENYLYPLPYEYYTDLHVRRYGFHGTSHKYVSEVAWDMLGNPEHSKVIICHLGNGASVSAVKNRKCVDTSMGFTPLDGIMMGTRSGEVDPSIMPYLISKLDSSPDEMLDVYNKKSGMLGISGISSDARDIENAYKKGDKRAILTSKIYARRIAKYIGQYFVELGGVDAIAFTAGVGENSAYLREMIVNDVKDALGIVLDEELNNTRIPGNRIISKEESQTKVMIIPTNEEVMIARDTVRLLNL
ncbi:MAG: acetate/propionate family kinase [Faecalibacillus sp.]